MLAEPLDVIFPRLLLVRTNVGTADVEFVSFQFCVQLARERSQSLHWFAMGCAEVVDRIQLVLGQGLVEVNRQSCPDSLFAISVKILVNRGLLLPRLVLHEDAEIGSGGNELLGMTLDSESRGELVFALLGRMLVTNTPEPFYGHFGIHFRGYLSVFRGWHTDVDQVAGRSIRDVPSVAKKTQRFDETLQLDVLELSVSSLNMLGLSGHRLGRGFVLGVL